jgi:tetratricopeptide (TPR) repeat protein
MSDKIPSLDDPQVRRHFEAARGYCELGLPQLARDEIEPFRATLGQSTELIEIELMILLQEKKWTDGLLTAQRLRKSLPAHPAGWLQAAFCLHELGRTNEALECLVDGPRSLRREALFHYNCACYLARLGQPDEALTSLKRALQIDPAYKKAAKSDPDLESLWGRL